MAPQSTWPSIIILTRVQPFQVSNSLNAAPFRDRGRFFSDFSRENADNYCLNERNRFAGKLTRLSSKFALSLSRFFKGVPPYEELCTSVHLSGRRLCLDRSVQRIILLTDGLNTQNRWSSTQPRYRWSPGDHLRQHQGGQRSVHDPGEYGDLAAELREQHGQVLSVDPDDHHLQHDRHQPDQVALRSIVAAQRWQTKTRLT